MKRFQDTNALKEHLVLVTAANHENLGSWTTAQIFYHLAAAFEASIDTTPLPAGFPATARLLIRPLRWVVTRIRFPPRLPIPAAIESKLKPPLNLGIMDQYWRLLRAIENFEQHTGEMPPHPVLGSLSRSEWTGFHLRHSEHHLSFIKLNESSPGIETKR